MSSRIRTPSGTPAGGQFTSTDRGESSANLAGGPSVGLSANLEVADRRPDPQPPDPPTRHQAYELLAGLRAGERVLFTESGRTMDLTVQDELHRPDGFGSWDYAAVVKVGYGVGRWNTEVNAARLSEGHARLERLPVPPATDLP